MISEEKIGPDKASLASAGSTKKLRVILKQPSNRPENEPSSWHRLYELFGGRNVRSTVGTCLGVFAVPLLIPGVTLTAVAFNDETGFARYGALHILGMVMLFVAAIFIVVGIVLNISCDNEVSPEDQLHSLSTHEKSPRNLDKPLGIQSSSHEAIQVGGTKGGSSPKQLHSMIQAGHNLSRENHVRFQNENVGAYPSLMIPTILKQQEPLAGINNGYVSSSEDDSSDDTDNRSSGSYILPELSDANTSSAVLCSVDERNPNVAPLEHASCRDNLGCDYQTDILKQDSLLESEKSKSNDDSSQLGNNFFQTKEVVKRPNNLSIGTGDALTSRKKINIKAIDVDSIPKMNLQDTVGEKSEVSESSPSKQTSPRVRLGAFSNASALASSMQMSNSEELLPKHLGVESFGSNVSVFSQDDAVRDGRAPLGGRLSDHITNSTKTFSFDVPTSHRGSYVSQENGPAIVDNHNRSEYAPRPNIETLSSGRYEENDSAQNIFRFHASQDVESQGITNPDVSNSSRPTSSPKPLKKSKKRQALSFPQGRASPLPSISLSVRQSAPPSLLVSSLGRDCA